MIRFGGFSNILSKSLLLPIPVTHICCHCNDSSIRFTLTSFLAAAFFNV